MSELLSCPFCGGKAEVNNPFGDTAGLWYVICTECAVCCGFENTEAEAVEAWNTRVERTCRIEHMPKNENLRCRSWLQCSECGEEMTNYPHDWNYCPNCGAKVVFS